MCVVEHLVTLISPKFNRVVTSFDPGNSDWLTLRDSRFLPDVLARSMQPSLRLVTEATVLSSS